jgi:transposase-like protein
MKSLSQILEKQVHQFARRKVRACAQPGVVLNIIEGEMNTFLTDVINQRLRQEQEQLLERSPYQRSTVKRYRNGFKIVRLRGLLSAWRLRKPVLREETPSSPILESLRRAGEGLLALIASRFWLRGCSTRAVAQEINGAFGTKMSASDVSRFTQTLLPDIQSWLSRPVPKGIAYLFLDAIYLPVRKPGFTSKQALLAAVGLTKDGKRHVLGFVLGDRENDDSWTALIKDLLQRGLDRSLLALVISDDHKAIQSAVEKELGVPHQLCVVHKMRNALVRVAAPHRKEFYADFTDIYWAASKEEALMALGRLQAKWFGLYPKATNIATTNPEAFLTFMAQPQALWTILRSTNLIERFNRELRRRLKPAGALHGENALWKLIWAVSTEQEKRWERRKIRNVKDLLKEAA